MSLNWVMLSEDKQSFTPLSGEQWLYTSPPRTTLTLQSENKVPGRELFSIQSNAGCVYLTNRRMVYLPANPSPTFESFAAPILNLHDTHVAAPFFGPNVWSAVVQPVAGGNIPPHHTTLELRMTFKDGGAFDFHSIYERIKERLMQAVDVARESGQLTGDGSEAGNGRGAGALGAMNFDMVNLDQLPAYEDAASATPLLSGFSARDSHQSPRPRPERSSDISSPPAEPPRYEEIQRESVADELERQLRNQELNQGI